MGNAGLLPKFDKKKIEYMGQDLHPTIIKDVQRKLDGKGNQTMGKTQKTSALNLVNQ